jgi:uncharacterized protein YjbI with pentapeptide repeats
MANRRHLAWLKQGVTAWNQWREANRNIEPDLSGAHLTEATLGWARTTLGCADLRGANFSRANLMGATLSWTDLRGADLSGANLIGANLSVADLRGLDLRSASFNRADLRQADLSGANLIVAVASQP